MRNKWHWKDNFISFQYTQKPNFDFSPVPFTFAIMPHIFGIRKTSIMARTV